MQIKTGDYVVRKSYHRDIIFKVKRMFTDEKGGTSVLLKGVAIRLLADAPIEDLESMKPEETAKIIAGTEKKELEQMLSVRGKQRQWRGADDGFFDFPGKVLHLDGDREYLDKSLQISYTQRRFSRS